MRLTIVLFAGFALASCATARMHDQAALNTVALGCGMTYGELIQDEEEKKLLIALKNNISAGQRACVIQWAKHNRLTPVFVTMESPEG